jgi:large subunit ribosomal protein L25
MSTNIHVLHAKVRNTNGSPEARRVRAEGQLPAVAYGKDLAALAIAIDPKETHQVLTSERGRNSVVKLEVEGKSEILAMVKSFQIHPVSRKLEHVDFIEVKLDREVDVEIPLFTTGKPVGIIKGGVLRQVYRALPVRCTPDLIPVKVTYDVTSLDLNGHVAAKDFDLGKGVSIRLTPEQTVISIVAPEADTEAVAAPGAPAAAAGKAAPAKAAPAKDAKKK